MTDHVPHQLFPDVQVAEPPLGETSGSSKPPERDSTQKNTSLIFCSRCGSKILLANTATHLQKRVFLPNMTQKSAIPKHSSKSSGASDSEDQTALYFLPDIPGEILEDFWLVADMYTFENIGVSNTVGTLRYLTCADCEIGPIGYQDMNKDDEFLIAWSRVMEQKISQT